MKVLVTGGAGFIGAHLVDRLLLDGHDVRVFDNFSTGSRENLLAVADDVELVEGDVRSYERAHHAVRNCDLVFHQAALPSVPRSVQDPLTSHEVNVVGSLNVLLASRDVGVQRVVLASSSSIYGQGPTLPKHEGMPPAPMSPYATAKLAAEGYGRTFVEVYGLETVALRYFNVFGPRQDPRSDYAAVIPNFIAAFLDGRSPIIHGDGEQSRDFTYIENVVEANVLAATAEKVGGSVFNIATGRRSSLNDLVSMLREITGRDVAAEYGPPRSGDVRHSLADLSRADRELGYRPTVDFREGLSRTVAHYAEEAAVS